MTSLSATASRCLDHQFRGALDLSVTCQMLSDIFRAADDPLTAVLLARLSSDLTDQVSTLLPLAAGPNGSLPSEPLPQSLSTGGEPETHLAELGCRLVHLALVARTDAMEPGLEAPVAALLQTLAKLYRSCRELLLLCTLVGSS
jgi:hypothetical protein